MKKILLSSVLFASVFFFANEVDACYAKTKCSDGSIIDCYGNKRCAGGPTYVNCYNKDGSFTSATCAPSGGDASL